jgi:hypothetical protein
MQYSFAAAAAVLLAAACGAGCRSSSAAVHGGPTDAGATTSTLAPSKGDAAVRVGRPRLVNRTAYIPAACYAKTRAAGGAARNSCFVCHTKSEAPNYTNDDDLQLRLSLPPLAAKNPWTNVLSPPVERVARVSDADVVSYVRKGNYFDAGGNVALARTLASPEWDANHDGKWGGFVPDVGYAIDERGFDHTRDGSATGWRAYAAYPVPGFLPANGVPSDVFIRLDPILREDASGKDDQATYEINLAIVESLVRRTDVSIDAADEKTLGVDLDLDGKLGKATHVSFDAAPDGSGKTRMHYVGRARLEERAGKLFIAPGMFPVGTELFHTVRYLDVREDGTVAMAPRMKEIRYARKTQFSSYAIAQANTIKEAREQAESPDGILDVRWTSEVGVYSTRGWVLQGFIEGQDGELRPQSYEETAYCEGCHGGVGATSDSTFSFARKLGDRSPARGWFHPSQHDWTGTPEPKRTDGLYEYANYLGLAGDGGDAEVRARFFDATGALRPDAVARLHEDVSTLFVPSPARALELDRAYLAIVKEQSFDHGRETPTTSGGDAGSATAFDVAPLGAETGIAQAVETHRLALR